MEICPCNRKKKLVDVGNATPNSQLPSALVLSPTVMTYFGPKRLLSCPPISPPTNAMIPAGSSHVPDRIADR